MRRRRRAAALAALLALSVCGVADARRKWTAVDGQAAAQNQGRTAAPRTEKKSEKKATNKVRPSRTREGESVSYKTVDHAAYTAGEIRRTVIGDESPVLHLGMAPSGATVVEFPASDRIFGVHTSDIGDWVRVEYSPTSRIDSHIVLRPGKDLGKGEAFGIVQVQMRSGLTVTLCVHAVKSAAQHTNRVVIIYDRDAIVAARRKAGLAVNLGEESGPQPIVVPTAPVQQLTIVEEEPPVLPPADAISSAEQASREIRKEKGADPETNDALKKALKDAMADPGSFKFWWGPTHGLSVAAMIHSLDERASVAVIAVKNVGDLAVQILPGHPELVIETVDKGKIIQLKSVEKLSEEASTRSNIIPGRTTVYYAVAFATPILGKQQRVRVTVGQRNAADDPAGANLATGVK
ncbi:MAG TPA: hypothetical protein VFV58_08075 [Blastocatellia bacterium]|jgi:hypothetical protein|nr:hypothetical protein [Blastocatellia bacterium]